MPKYNNPRRTWVYSNDFKYKAVKLTLQPDTKVKDVAEGLGIHPMMLSRWRSEYRQGVLQGDEAGHPNHDLWTVELVFLFSQIPAYSRGRPL